MESQYKLRGEEIQEIIDRMPTKFGYWVTAIIALLVVFLLVFGWFIEYPDTVSGTVVINAKYSAVKLVANTSGKINLLNHHTKQAVKEGEYISIIQNAANMEDVLKVKGLINQFNVNETDCEKHFREFPVKVSLGELNEKYYLFLSSLQKAYQYLTNNIYEKQKEGLLKQLEELRQLQDNNLKLMSTRKKNLELYKKMLDRDSSLLAEKVATEAEVDNSRVSFLSNKERYESITSDINTTSQKITDTDNKLKQLLAEEVNEERDNRLKILTTYDDLKDGINSWEQQFVFKAPMDGIVEYLKFWANNQFIQTGEEAFNIIPQSNKMLGQLHLPAQGAGKVKVGQEVKIKLDNYPFQEYGYIKGKVTSISLSTNVIKSAQNNIDAYLIEVELPDRLTTNYGMKLDNKSEIKGQADIITSNRKLLQRFFDNLRYSSGKQ